jgi:formimidoylglutamase
VEDPSWPRASGWLKSASAVSPSDGRPLLAVLGCPLSQGSISPTHAEEAPAAVRSALAGFSPFAAGVGWPEPQDLDLDLVNAIDLGDLALIGLDLDGAQALIADAAAKVAFHPRLARRPDLLVLLGGHNGITRPALRGLAGRLDRAGLLTLDAHHDVRDFHAGPTNGTPVRGLILDGLPGTNVIQIGIGAFSNSKIYREWADDQGITVVTAAAARREGVGSCVERHLEGLAARCELLFVDLDVDVLDAAFAPGCPGARPGGLFPAELHEAAFAAGIHPKVAGLDIVEVDPERDPTGITARNAALCLLHAAVGLALRSRD